jgi:hypothetical protein
MTVHPFVGHCLPRRRTQQVLVDVVCGPLKGLIPVLPEVDQHVLLVRALEDHGFPMSFAGWPVCLAFVNVEIVLHACAHVPAH